MLRIKTLTYKFILHSNFLKFLYRNEVVSTDGVNPFFIIGSGRSGNTLLRRILNNNEDLYIPPETYVLGQIIRQYYRHPLMRWEDLVNSSLEIFERHPEFETFELSSLGRLKVDLRKKVKSKRNLADIINSFYEYYKLEHNLTAGRWGDKTPLNVFALNELLIVFPKSQYIHIIRDPLDAVSSYIKSEIYSDVVSATNRWVRAVELSCAFGRNNPDQYMEVFYSDLVSNPKKTTVEVCDFLGVGFQEEMLKETSKNMGDVKMRKHHYGVMMPINKDSLGRGMKELSIRERDYVFKRLALSTEPVITALLSHYSN